MLETKSPMALTMDNVTAGYGQTHILHGLSLTIARGERIAVIGRNGAGKTTMLSTIMGLTRLHGGRVHLGNEDISQLSPHQRSMRGLGLVPRRVTSSRRSPSRKISLPSCAAGRRSRRPMHSSRA